MASLVFVHGVGHHSAGHTPQDVATARSATMAQHIASGIGIPAADVPVSYAYYAHHLYRGTPTAQGPTDGAAACDQLERDEPGAALRITAWVEALDDALDLGIPHATPQGRLAVPLRQLATLIATRLSLDGRLTQLFVACFFREVGFYLRDPEGPARISARAEVAAAIERSGARIVVAHSLGSVVAYEALHERPDLPVDLLLTLGSPLALPHSVFTRLSPQPQNGVGQRPPNVRRWVNLSDHGDVVAIPRPFKKHFPDVDLDLAESIGPFDFHRAARYLRSAAVAATLAPYLPKTI